MENQLSTLLIEIKQYEDESKKLSDLISEKRAEVLNELNTQELKQYKDDIATISFTERKTIKYKIEKEELLKKLEEQKLVKYIDIIPEQIIPETKQINKMFEDDIKNGITKFNDVDIEIKEIPMIRFNK